MNEEKNLLLFGLDLSGAGTCSLGGHWRLRKGRGVDGNISCISCGEIFDEKGWKEDLLLYVHTSFAKMLASRLFQLSRELCIGRRGGSFIFTFSQERNDYTMKN